LVVDDEKMIADTLAMILSEYGFDALAIYSGELAVSTEINMNPDLLISDLMMRGLDGIETAVRIRALMPDCKVILHSGHVDMADSSCEIDWKSTRWRSSPSRFTLRLC
jgi:DNA-binding response OmpR family regulator